MRALRLVVRSLGELSITLGALLLLFLGWQLFWTDVVADRAQQATTDALIEQWDAAGSGTDGTGTSDSGTEGSGPGDGVGDGDGTDASDSSGAVTDEQAEAVLRDLPSQALALIRVPAFGADYARPVLAGTGTDVLKQGIGHYAGTAMPGEVGNFAVAGHRTTYGAPFNPIAELQAGDPVVVETADSYYVYRVERHQVVLPGEVEVIAPVPDRPGEQPTEAVLTMTSCHPMFSARERYIVHAVLESSSPRSDGPPAVLAAAGVG